jgi:hypothetical protein
MTDSCLVHCSSLAARDESFVEALNCSTITPLSPYHAVPFVYPPTPPYCSASAFRAQSCWINCCARARTRSSLSSKARINGSTAPGGADCAQVSRARSRTRTFGELSLWAIHSGTTRPSTGCPSSEDRTGTALGLSPPETVPVPDAEPFPFPEARGAGLASVVAGMNESLRGDEPCLDRDDPSTLALGPRFGALSDEAGPQPASPARNSRLRGIARHSRDGRMSLDLSGGASMGIGNGSREDPILRRWPLARHGPWHPYLTKDRRVPLSVVSSLRPPS